MNKILVTGAAGFIGFHLSHRLLAEGKEVVGLDNLNDYYEVTLKHARLKQIKDNFNFKFHKIDLSDNVAIENLFCQENFDIVINLAAQAGVRYSLTNPHVYTTSNLVGFTNILEGCRVSQVKHLIFASSSSVYGANTKTPFSVHDNVDHPLNLYAASKKANELMAHAYSHLYNLPVTGLRFFSVYGPWGRPDMALFIFTKAILSNQPINVFNNGQMYRDFTYIDDIVEGIIQLMKKTPQPNFLWSGKHPEPGTSSSPYKIYNIGNNNPVNLMYFIEVLENCLGIKAQKNMLPLQPGDVPINFANVDELIQDVGFSPSTKIERGIQLFVDWYRQYYNV
jgi:UDP-glucuronate 4-epimerase